jgi:hypothetical protein
MNAAHNRTFRVALVSAKAYQWSWILRTRQAFGGRPSIANLQLPSPA